MTTPTAPPAEDATPGPACVDCGHRMVNALHPVGYVACMNKACPNFLVAVAPPSSPASATPTPEPRLSNIEIPEVDNSAAGEAGAQEEATHEIIIDGKPFAAEERETLLKMAVGTSRGFDRSFMFRYEGTVRTLESALSTAEERVTRAEQERDALMSAVQRSIDALDAYRAVKYLSAEGQALYEAAVAADDAMRVVVAALRTPAPEAP